MTDSTPITELFNTYSTPDIPYTKKEGYASPPEEPKENKNGFDYDNITLLLKEPLIVVVVFFILNSVSIERIFNENIPSLQDYFLLIKAFSAGVIFYGIKLLFKN